MNGILSLATVLLAAVLLSVHPAGSMPVRAPLADPDFIPSLQNANGHISTSSSENMPRAQETSLNEEVAKNEQLLPILWSAYNAYRNRQTPVSNEPSIQADSANGGNIDLDALTDQFQNILNNQLSATTPTESVAEAQRRRYWPIIRDFLDNIFSPTDAPSKQPDTTALAEDLENALNMQILSGAVSEPVVSQPVARTQFWSSIRKFVGDLFGKQSGAVHNIYINMY